MEEPSAANWTGPGQAFADGKVEKAAIWFFAALVAYGVAKNVVVAGWKPFWYDEICTRIVAGQASIGAIWGALRQAADGNPPPYYLVERLFGGLPVREEVAYRLPSILALGSTLVCVFVFVRRRSGEVVAAASGSTLLLTAVFDVYAAEARPYSIVVASVALALVCYQRASSAGWVIALGCVLALAETMHYFAVVCVAPFALGEAVLALREKKVRAGVWAALMSPLGVLAVLWPYLEAMKERYGAHPWSPAEIYTAAATYEWLFDRRGGMNAELGLVVPLVVATALGVVLAIPSWRGRWMRDPFFHEHALVLGLLGLPYAGYAAAAVGHGGYTARYALATALCLPLAAGYVVGRLGRAGMLVFAAVVLLTVAICEGRSWEFHRAEAGNPAVFAERLIDSAGRDDLPVVISDGREFLPIAYYASGEWVKRFVSVEDVPAAVAYSGTDSLDQQLLVMRSIRPFEVYEFSVFAPRHSEFLLYSSGVAPWDWWPERLRREGHGLELLASDGSRAVYVVRLRRSTSE